MEAIQAELLVEAEPGLRPPSLIPKLVILKAVRRQRSYM